MMSIPMRDLLSRRSSGSQEPGEAEDEIQYVPDTAGLTEEARETAINKRAAILHQNLLGYLDVGYSLLVPRTSFHHYHRDRS